MFGFLFETKKHNEAKARLARAIEQIESATNTSIRNHQELPQFTSDMYADATHFTRYHGDIAYIQFLVEELKVFFDDL